MCMQLDQGVQLPSRVRLMTLGTPGCSPSVCLSYANHAAQVSSRPPSPCHQHYLSCCELLSMLMPLATWNACQHFLSALTGILAKLWAADHQLLLGRLTKFCVTTRVQSDKQCGNADMPALAESVAEHGMRASNVRQCRTLQAPRCQESDVLWC